MTPPSASRGDRKGSIMVYPEDKDQGSSQTSPVGDGSLPVPPDRTCFSVVFEGDLRALKFNPLTHGNPLGKVRSVGFGDAFAEFDARFPDAEIVDDGAPTRQEGRLRDEPND